MNRVVRAGDTVRRTTGPWTSTVHRLLGHLREHGFSDAPEALGLTDDGREVLSFIPGTVPAYPMPAWVWTDTVLVESGRMLRRFHDATVGFDESGAIWQAARHEPSEVIAHNDFSPHNLVFVAGRVAGVIDVDMCSPGPRVWDVAYLATRLVPLVAGGAHGSASDAELRRRLALLTDAYGPFSGDLLAVAHERLLDLAVFSESKAAELGNPRLRDDAGRYREQARWLARGRMHSRTTP